MTARILRTLRNWIGSTPAKTRKRTTVRPRVEQLEDRLTPSAGAREQYMLELVNRMRENPAAELQLLLNSGDANVNNALAYFNVDRQTLQNQWSSLVAAPALAWNDTLAGTAYAHDQAMQNAGQQSHQVSGEASLGTRISNAGYSNWSALGENIFAYADSTFEAHAAFAIDWGNTSTGIQAPAGHRDNLMSTSFRDIGIGLLDAPSDPNVGPLLVTQDFGNRYGYGNPFLVGVVFNDANTNGYYDMSEGLGNVTLSISGNGVSTSMSTTAYGGYQLQLGAGTYTITASGGGLSASITQTVTVGSSNVHLNFINGFQPQDVTSPFSDNFNRSNNGLLGISWKEVQGNFDIVSNAAQTGMDMASIATLNGISTADVSLQADVNVGSTGLRSAGLIARYSGSGDSNMYFGAVVGSSGAYSAVIYLNSNGAWSQLASTSIASGSGTLRFETAGTSLRLYLNNSLVVSATDSTLTTGTAGLRAYNQSTIDNFSIGSSVAVANATLPFSDALLGSGLSSYWTTSVGNFARSGSTLQSANGPNLATLNGINQANVSMQADITLAATGLQFAELVARYSGSGDTNMYAGILGASNGVYSAYIYVNVNGNWTQLSSASVNTGTGTLRFETVGSSLKLFLNSQLLTYAYDNRLTTGSVGIRAYNVAGYANFSAAAITQSNATLTFTDTLAGSQLSGSWTNRAGAFAGNSGTMTAASGAASLATLNGIGQANVAVQADISLAATGFQAAGLAARYSGSGDTNMYVGGISAANGVYSAYIFVNLNGAWIQLSSATVSTGAGTLRFEAVGSALKLFFNNQLVTYAYDSSLTTGSVGLRAYHVAGYTNFSASAVSPINQTLPFNDSFAGLASGAQLSRSWSNRAGTFSSNGAGKMSSSTSGASLATVNGINAADETVQADVSVTLSGTSAGVVTRYSGSGDDSMYLGVLANANGVMFAQIYRNWQGAWTLLASTTVASNTGTLRMQSIGSAQRLYWNNVLVASATDNTLTTGSVGIRSTLQALTSNFSAS